MSTLPVAVVRAENATYPASPFHPDASYPELRAYGQTSSGNAVYCAVRELFRLLAYDAAGFDTAAWNPLGWLVKPGDTVFIKPNMIAHKHLDTDEWEHVITHGSVLRAVIDYVYIALGGTGRIVIGDGPQTDSDFDQTVARTGLADIQTLYRREKNFPIEIVDLRDERWIVLDDVVVETIKLPGDPAGGVAVDLGRRSMFAENDHLQRRYYGAFYDIDETNRHHRDGRHEYAFSRSPLSADVFISLPKLKTHKKCGLTVNLKGAVGLNANKNWLPHYALGSPETGGDQFPAGTSKSKLENLLVVNAKKLLAGQNRVAQQVARATKKTAYKFFGTNTSVVRSGNWHGNDTVWRMVLDLNRVLMYANADGTLRPAGDRKRFFSLVDGIVSMEGDGPVAGTRKETELLVAGDNPVAVDAVCAGLMGFDRRCLPMLTRCFEPHELPLVDGGIEDICVASNVGDWNKPLARWTVADSLHFRPHFGWRGRIELDRP